MMRLPNRTSRAITTFSFLATLLVVACHTDDVMPSEAKTFLVRFLGGSFSDANVCNFFFLSGFLLARHFDESGWWKQAMVSRIRSLAIPYFAWCALYFFTSAKFCTFISETSAAFTAANGGLIPTVLVAARAIKRVFGIGLLTHPYGFPLWYIKTLLYFVFASSIVFPFILAAKRRFWCALGVVLAFYELGHGLHLCIMPYFGFCFHLLGFAAFLSGAYCSIHGILALPDRLSRASPIVPLFIWFAVSAIHMTVAQATNCGAILTAPVNIAVSMLCLVWISFTATWRIPGFVPKCLFFVYAAHIKVLCVFRRIPHHHPATTWNSFLMFVVYLLGAVAICFGLAHAISRICPQAASVLTGGRFERNRKCIKRDK